MENKKEKWGYTQWLSHLRKSGLDVAFLIEKIRNTTDEKWKKTITKNLFNLFTTALDQNGEALVFIVDYIYNDAPNRFDGMQKDRMYEIAIKTSPSALKYLPSGADERHQSEALRMRPDLFYLAKNPSVADILFAIDADTELIKKVSVVNAWRIIKDFKTFKTLPGKTKYGIILRCMFLHDTIELILASGIVIVVLNWIFGG